MKIYTSKYFSTALILVSLFCSGCVMSEKYDIWWNRPAGYNFYTDRDPHEGPKIMTFPSFPDELLKKKKMDSVDIKFVVDVTGKVTFAEAAPLAPDLELAKIAAATVLTWKMWPGKIKGESISMQGWVTIPYKSKASFALYRAGKELDEIMKIRTPTVVH